MAPCLWKGCPSVPQSALPPATPQPTAPASCLKRALKFSSISSSESTCWMEKEGKQVRGAPAQPRMGSRRQQLKAGLGPPISYMSLHITEPHSSHLQNANPVPALPLPRTLIP